MHQLTANVTQEIIDTSLNNLGCITDPVKKPDNISRCLDCPVAIALTKAIQTIYPTFICSTGGRAIVIHRNREEYIHNHSIGKSFLPLKLGILNKILRFDNVGRMEPFSFPFEIPEGLE